MGVSGAIIRHRLFREKVSTLVMHVCSKIQMRRNVLFHRVGGGGGGGKCVCVWGGWDGPRGRSSQAIVCK